MYALINLQHPIHRPCRQDKHPETDKWTIETRKNWENEEQHQPTPCPLDQHMNYNSQHLQTEACLSAVSPTSLRSSWIISRQYLLPTRYLCRVESQHLLCTNQQGQEASDHHLVLYQSCESVKVVKKNDEEKRK